VCRSSPNRQGLLEHSNSAKRRQNARERSELRRQAGSKTSLVALKEKHWKLLIQSNKQRTKFVPAGLFDFPKNPQKGETGNLLQLPDYKDRVKKMLERYIEIVRSGVRATPLNVGV
jgi:hypothetical protein